MGVKLACSTSISAATILGRQPSSRSSTAHASSPWTRPCTNPAFAADSGDAHALRLHEHRIQRDTVRRPRYGARSHSRGIRGGDRDGHTDGRRRYVRASSTQFHSAGQLPGGARRPESRDRRSFGRTFRTLTVINVNLGMEFSINATAIADLTSTAFYRNYNDPYPDFNSAEVNPVTNFMRRERSIESRPIPGLMQWLPRSWQRASVTRPCWIRRPDRVPIG